MRGPPPVLGEMPYLKAGQQLQQLAGLYDARVRRRPAMSFAVQRRKGLVNQVAARSQPIPQTGEQGPVQESEHGDQIERLGKLRRVVLQVGLSQLDGLNRRRASGGQIAHRANASGSTSTAVTCQPQDAMYTASRPVPQAKSSAGRARVPAAPARGTLWAATNGRLRQRPLLRRSQNAAAQALAGRCSSAIQPPVRRGRTVRPRE